MKLFHQIVRTRLLPVWAGLILLLLCNETTAQQIIWAKLFSLPEEDQITCLTQDSLGDVYAGGCSYRGAIFPGNKPRAVIYKLNPEGDTIFSLWTGYYGYIQAMSHSPEGYISIALLKRSPSQLVLLRMSYEGFIFKRDTVPSIIYVNYSCTGKDSSWILCGYTPNPINGFIEDFYAQRVRKDGIIEPMFTLNNNFSGRAHRVEQLPNGKYLVSGSAGSYLISYTFDENLSNPQPMHTWYQTQDSSGLSVGAVGLSSQKGFVIGGQSSNSFVGLLDSLGNTMWLKKDSGVIIMPQAMADGSILSGYSQRPTNPTHLFTRRAADSSTVWFLNLRDSLAFRGLQGNLILKAYTFFEDESAVIAATLQRGTVVPYTAEDPFFIKIANVGTPITALTKPKRGTLSNETLAPWPNPSGGTLYLKQHFDKAEVHFYTVSGREVQTDTVRFGQPIDISSFAPGLYLYRAVIDGKPFSGKVFKN